MKEMNQTQLTAAMDKAGQLFHQHGMRLRMTLKAMKKEIIDQIGV
jgi:hypothetical protein